MNFLKKAILLGCALVMMMLANCQQQTNSTDFTITGSNWDKYEGYTFNLGVQDSSDNGISTIGKSLIMNGEIKVQGHTNYVRNAFWSVTDSDGKLVTKGNCIVEPGNYSLHLKDKLVNMAMLNFEGGKYSTILYKDVFDSPDVIAALKAYFDFEATLTEADTMGTANYRKSVDIYQALPTALTEHYVELSTNHKDPVVRMLAMSFSYLELDKMKKEVLALQEEIGDHPEFITLNQIIQVRENYLQKAKISVGTAVKDFTAKDLSGKEFHLANVLKENKYTLVEFWASWCGPCRGEIPHMKKAYSHYKDKGFEIVSFSIDHSEKQWRKASEEDQIPWINTSDLLARKSPVVKLYGVTGVPNNYLVNGSGEIIAKDLRGDDLDHKLEELLGK